MLTVFLSVELVLTVQTVYKLTWFKALVLTGQSGFPLGFSYQMPISSGSVLIDPHQTKTDSDRI